MRPLIADVGSQADPSLLLYTVALVILWAAVRFAVRKYRATWEPAPDIDAVQAELLACTDDRHMFYGQPVDGGTLYTCASCPVETLVRWGR